MESKKYLYTFVLKSAMFWWDFVFQFFFYKLIILDFFTMALQ